MRLDTATSVLLSALGSEHIKEILNGHRLVGGIIGIVQIEIDVAIAFLILLYLEEEPKSTLDGDIQAFSGLIQLVLAHEISHSGVKVLYGERVVTHNLMYINGTGDGE